MRRQEYFAAVTRLTLAIGEYPHGSDLILGAI